MNIPMFGNFAVRSSPQQKVNKFSISSLARAARNIVKKTENSDKPNKHKSLLDVIEQGEKRKNTVVIEKDSRNDDENGFPKNLQQFRIIIPCQAYVPQLPSSKAVKKSGKEKIDPPNKPIIIQQQVVQEKIKGKITPSTNSFWFEEQDKQSIIDKVYDQPEPSPPAGKKMKNFLEDRLEQTEQPASLNQNLTKSKGKKKEVSKKKPALKEVQFRLQIDICQSDKQPILPANTNEQAPVSTESPAQNKTPLLTYTSQPQPSNSDPDVIIIDQPKKTLFLTGKASILELVQQLYKRKLIKQALLKEFTTNHKQSHIHDYLKKFSNGTLQKFPYQTIKFTLLDHRRISELLKALFPDQYQIGPVKNPDAEIYSFMNKMYNMAGEDYYNLYAQIDNISKVKWYSKILTAQDSKFAQNQEQRKKAERKAIKANKEVQRVLESFGAKLRPLPSERRSGDHWRSGKKKQKQA